MASNNPPKLCQICLKESQKYSCPRCNIFYCSVNCYKSQAHSQCSESFYKECVIEEMSHSNSLLNDSSATKQMQEILKRLESGQQSDSQTFDLDDLNNDEIDSDDDIEDESEEELAERLTEIDLNDADAVWNKLTTAEKQEFENIVKNGDISNLCLEQEPWWMDKFEPIKIEEINSTTTKLNQPKLPKNMPSIYKSIIDFAKLSTKTPSEAVFYNLKNILTAYTFTVRYFYGDLFDNNQFDNPLEACSYLISICANLKSNTNFDDSDLAIDSVAHECRTEGVMIHKEQVKQMHADIDSLIQGPNKLSPSNLYILAALSDLYRLILAGKKALTQQDQDSSTNIGGGQKSNNKLGEFSKRFVDHEIINFEIVNKKNLSCILKKIEYFLSFVKTFK